MGAGDCIVFVGTYTNGPGHCPHGKGEGIYVYKMDGSTGTLEHLSTTSGAINPSFFDLSKHGEYLYVASEIGDYKGTQDGAMLAYSVDPSSGALTHLNTVPATGATSCHVILDSSDSCVFVANYGAEGNNSVAVFRKLADGQISEAACTMRHEGSGPNPARQEAPHPHSVVLSPNEKFLYVPDLGIDQVKVYSFSVNADVPLSPAACPPAQLPAGSGPRSFCFHPSGQFCYVILELGSLVCGFAHDSHSGALAPLPGAQAVSTLPPGVDGPQIESTCAHIEIHPNGKWLYGSNRGHDSIAVYDIHPGTGALTAVAFEPTQGKCPRNFKIDPSGRFLLAANQDSDSIISFTIDTTTGRLNRVEGDDGIVSLSAPVCIKFLPIEK